MKSGTARLFRSKNGDFLTQRRYISKLERLRTVEYWRKLYGEGFKNTYITYEPESSPESVNRNGTNKVTNQKELKAKYIMMVD